jgi:hypothetical protein
MRPWRTGPDRDGRPPVASLRGPTAACAFGRTSPLPGVPREWDAGSSLSPMVVTFVVRRLDPMRVQRRTRRGLRASSEVGDGLTRDHAHRLTPGRTTRCRHWPGPRRSCPQVGCQGAHPRLRAARHGTLVRRPPGGQRGDHRRPPRPERHSSSLAGDALTRLPGSNRASGGRKNGSRSSGGRDSMHAMQDKVDATTCGWIRPVGGVTRPARGLRLFPAARCGRGRSA